MAQRWSFMRLAACLPFLLAALPSFAANAGRTLDLDGCESQFEAYRQNALTVRRERLARARSHATPRPDNIAKLEKEVAEAQNVSGGDFFGSLGGGPNPGHMHSFLQTLPQAEVRRRQKQETDMLAFLKAGDYERYESIKGARPTGPAEASYLQAMSMAHLCGYDARMTQLTGKAPPARESMTAADTMEKNTRTDAPARQGGGWSPKECDARNLQLIAIKIPSNASITTSTETVMFITRTVMDMLDGGCPGVTPEQRISERQHRQEQYAAAEQACNAVQSGGRRCVARNHFGPGGAPQAVASGANDCEDIKADALAKMRKLNTSFPEPERFIAIRVGHHPREAEACRLAQHHARFTFDTEGRYRKEYEDLKNDSFKRTWASYPSDLEGKARALDLAMANSAIGKVEICSACGRAAVPSGTPGTATGAGDARRPTPSAPSSDWETSPGIRR
ncbi:hypothetical protein [Janthinobacterium sp. 17J80-10]|uniref:hypothetical protein n=1 Tax=Janthinobacterium sp. 17J80-10 TaxID=2497863 RepID=UPI0010054954|nr:hypothetical protein [Janthinobacterium sp. 17J80-10]QAU35195.1 hypothetical protein EKL02_13975 [Janthinobacterium sp. 17J80-10]